MSNNIKIVNADNTRYRARVFAFMCKLDSGERKIRWNFEVEKEKLFGIFGTPHWCCYGFGTWYDNKQLAIDAADKRLDEIHEYGNDTFVRSDHDERKQDTD